jgi:hypothetical protein
MSEKVLAQLLRDHAEELLSAVEGDGEPNRARIALVANALCNMAADIEKASLRTKPKGGSLWWVD